MCSRELTKRLPWIGLSPPNKIGGRSSEFIYYIYIVHTHSQQLIHHALMTIKYLYFVASRFLEAFVNNHVRISLGVLVGLILLTGAFAGGILVGQLLPAGAQVP